MSKIYHSREFSTILSYSDDDIANILGVKRNTVIGWRKNGLEPIDQHKPSLYHGCNVKGVLGSMNNKKKRMLELEQFYCLKCRDAQTPYHSEFSADIRGSQCQLKAVCPDCKKMMHKVVNMDQLYQVQRKIKQVDLKRLYDSYNPHLKPQKLDNKVKGEKTCLF